MTDQELIKAFRRCDSCGDCCECPLDGTAECPFTEITTKKLVDRLEALLLEYEQMDANQNASIEQYRAMEQYKNELHLENRKLKKEIGRLKAGKDTNVPTKWVSVDEQLPHFNQPYIVTACDENAPAGEGIWYSTVVVVAEFYNGCWTWDDGGLEYDLTGLVTHWQPLPNPPSTEGVE